MSSSLSLSSQELSEFEGLCCAGPSTGAAGVVETFCGEDAADAGEKGLR